MSPPARIVLSLDGFEPDGPGLATFVAFRATRRWAQASPVGASIVAASEEVVRAGGAATSTPWAITFALLTACPDPAAALRRWRREGGAAARRSTPLALLAAVAAPHQREGQLLVQVDPETTLPDHAGAWLVASAHRLGAVSVAFSCEPSAAEDLAGDAGDTADPIRLGQAATRAAAQAPAGLPGGPAMDGEVDQALRRFLELAALCGSAAPVRPLLSALGLGEEAAERLVDLLDEHLCGGDAPVLEDLGYRHPGFPGQLAYAFRDPAQRRRLLAGLPEAHRVALAQRLRAHLAPLLPVKTRAVARLFVNLGEAAGPPAGEGPRQRLRLWGGADDAGALERALREDLQAGRQVASTLRATALSEGPLSDHVRMAMLCAITGEAPCADPSTALAEVLRRTSLLREAGRLAEAAASAEDGLRWLATVAEPPAGARGALLFLAAQCHRARHRPAAALERYAQAADEAARPGPDGEVDHARLGACLGEAGRCHSERGEWAEAIRLLGDALHQLGLGLAQGRVEEGLVALVERNLAACRTQAARAGRA